MSRSLRLLGRLTAVAVLTTLVLGASASDAALLRFGLCADNIGTVEIAEPRKGSAWTVLVGLRAAAKQELRALTEMNIGEELEVFYGDTSFVRARIQAKISSGVISAPYATREEAERVREAIRASGTDRCGGSG